jgi:hypothetical protein
MITVTITAEFQVGGGCGRTIEGSGGCCVKTGRRLVKGLGHRINHTGCSRLPRQLIGCCGRHCFRIRINSSAQFETDVPYANSCDVLCDPTSSPVFSPHDCTGISIRVNLEKDCTIATNISFMRHASAW